MFLGQIFAKNAKNDPKTLLKRQNRSKNKIRKISVKSRNDVKSAFFFTCFLSYLSHLRRYRLEILCTYSSAIAL